MQHFPQSLFCLLYTSIEPGLDLVLVHILQQRIIGDGGQVIKLVIVDVNRKAFGYKLAYVTVDYRIGFAAARCPDNLSLIHILPLVKKA